MFEEVAIMLSLRASLKATQQNVAYGDLERSVHARGRRNVLRSSTCVGSSSGGYVFGWNPKTEKHGWMKIDENEGSG